MSPPCLRLWLLWLLPVQPARVTNSLSAEGSATFQDKRRMWRHRRGYSVARDSAIAKFKELPTPDFSDSLDAIAVCGGAPSAKTLAEFDAPCDDNPVPESLEPVTVLTQDGPYRMPPRRLYVCHPNARIRGWLFFDGKATDIKTQEHLERIASQLFDGSLFPFDTYWPDGITWRTNGDAWQNTTMPSQQLIWVLDRDGNFIISPEVYDGMLYKHGDLTPGAFPWSRPVGDSGMWRGVARTGGELRFPKNDRPLLQDLSSYAALAVRVEGLAEIAEGIRKLVPERFEPDNGPGIDGVLDWGQPMPVHGLCAIGRFKKYLQNEVKFPLDGVDVAAAFFDNEEDAWEEKVARYEEV